MYRATVSHDCWPLLRNLVRLHVKRFPRRLSLSVCVFHEARLGGRPDMQQKFANRLETNLAKVTGVTANILFSHPALMNIRKSVYLRIITEKSS